MKSNNSLSLERIKHLDIDKLKVSEKIQKTNYKVQNVKKCFSIK